MSKDKKFPAFNSDEALEKFVDDADLSEYDFSNFKPVSFEFEPKNASVTLRMPESLLQAVKKSAEAHGMPYQRFMRSAIEKALQSSKAV